MSTRVFPYWNLEKLDKLDHESIEFKLKTLITKQDMEIAYLLYSYINRGINRDNCERAGCQPSFITGFSRSKAEFNCHPVPLEDLKYWSEDDYKLGDIYERLSEIVRGFLK